MKLNQCPLKVSAGIKSNGQSFFSRWVIWIYPGSLHSIQHSLIITTEGEIASNVKSFKVKSSWESPTCFWPQGRTHRNHWAGPLSWDSTEFSCCHSHASSPFPPSTRQSVLCSDFVTPFSMIYKCSRRALEDNQVWGLLNVFSTNHQKCKFSPTNWTMPVRLLLASNQIT